MNDTASSSGRDQEISKRLLAPQELAKRALALFGLAIEQQKQTYWYSKPFGTYRLKGKFLEALRAKGFKLTEREDGIITLSDENPQKPAPGYAPSNYWNFRNDKERKDELLLSLGIISTISQRQRGVILLPHVTGTFFSPCDQPPQLRIFQVVAQFDKKTHPVVREIVEGKGEKVIGWTNIRLGGIRSLTELFAEFAFGKEAIEQLAHSRLSPFRPAPCEGGEFRYLPEPYQSTLFQIWKEQLDIFKSRL